MFPISFVFFKKLTDIERCYDKSKNVEVGKV